MMWVIALLVYYQAQNHLIYGSHNQLAVTKPSKLCYNKWDTLSNLKV